MVQVARSKYELQYVSLLRVLTLGYAARRQWEAAESWGARWVMAEPYNEEAHETLIFLFGQTRRPARARAAYKYYVALWHELGLQPTAFADIPNCSC
jgi:DNA-binding SARP family transcriptional activator